MRENIQYTNYRGTKVVRGLSKQEKEADERMLRIVAEHKDGKTMAAIAKEEQRSPERIRQIIYKAKKRGLY